MNIFTSSSPDINPDKLMMKEPASASQNNDNVENSTFATMVNDAGKSALKPEDKKEAYSTKEDTAPSRPEPAKNNNDVKTDQHMSHDNNSKDDSGSEGAVSDVTTEKVQDTEVSQPAFESNNINEDAGEDTEITDKETVNDNAPIAEQVSIFEQTLSTEIAIPNQGSEQDVGQGNISEEAGSSVKDNMKNIDINIESVAVSDKQQGKTVNDRGHINNESEDMAMDLALDEITSEELNAEDGQDQESGAENKASNKNSGFGNSDLEELPEEFDLNGELKEKIKHSAARELPERYVKKTVIDQSEIKTIQSHINGVDPEVLEELNNVKTLQDGILSGNTQNPAYNSGLTHTLKGVSDTTLKTLESLHSNTTITNAEIAQHQANTMAGGKAGAGLSHANAARTAGFSELLNHVVYVAKGKNRLGVTINHEEFGKLKINVSMEKGIMNIHVNASDKVVREFLESNVQSIVESLSKDGVNVGGFSVALKDHTDDPEKKFLMDSGLHRQYGPVPAAVHSAEGLVNVFA